jgi:hypothetical protein
MPEPELSIFFIRPLNLAGIRYAVSGSVAAIIYGEPRLKPPVLLITRRRRTKVDGSPCCCYQNL